jgi:hypothetical protein
MEWGHDNNLIKLAFEKDSLTSFAGEIACEPSCCEETVDAHA